MTEVTRVPLQPIAKGSLLKLWIGVAIAVLLAAGVAWAAMPQGVTVDTITAGEGASPTRDDVVFVRYTGRLEDGTVFDQSQGQPWPVPGILPEGAPLPLSDMIPGFAEALTQMQRGGTYEVFIPAEQGYGSDVPEGGPIPPDSNLLFNVELVDFMSRQEAEGRFQTMMQMMQATQQPADGQAATEGAPQQ